MQAHPSPTRQLPIVLPPVPKLSGLRSKSAPAKARTHHAARTTATMGQQEKPSKKSWYRKLVPNDHEEFRRLVEPRPEEIANSIRLDVLGRTVTILCVPRRSHRSTRRSSFICLEFFPCFNYFLLSLSLLSSLISYYVRLSFLKKLAVQNNQDEDPKNTCQDAHHLTLF